MKSISWLYLRISVTVWNAKVVAKVLTRRNVVRRWHAGQKLPPSKSVYDLQPPLTLTICAAPSNHLTSLVSTFLFTRSLWCKNKTTYESCPRWWWPYKQQQFHSPLMTSPWWCLAFVMCSSHLNIYQMCILCLIIMITLRMKQSYQPWGFYWAPGLSMVYILSCLLF